MDVALNVGGRLQSHHYPANDSRNLSAHDHPLGADGAGDFTLFTDYDLAAPDIALHLAVDLKCALADDPEPLTNDLEIVTDDRFGSRFDRTAARLLLRYLAGGRGVGAGRLERLRLGRRVTREHEPLLYECGKNYRVDPRQRIPMEGRSVHPSLLQGSPHRLHLALGALAFGLVPGLGFQNLPFHAANELKSETAEVVANLTGVFSPIGAGMRRDEASRLQCANA